MRGSLQAARTSAVGGGGLLAAALVGTLWSSVLAPVAAAPTAPATLPGSAAASVPVTAAPSALTPQSASVQGNAVSATVAASVPTSRYLPGTHCRAFPADDYWHADISHLPVNPRSAVWLSHMQASTRHLHADFGPSFGAQPVPYGIPITVVTTSTPKVAVRFTYANESNRTGYPLSRTTRIEGGWNAGGDRHAIVVNASTCVLYETWNTRLTSTGWTAGSGAVWHLTSDALRPAGWTSADAAGLPILPGLLRYDEVAAGHVDHAIRFTTNSTDRTYVWPARHQAGSVNSRAYPPMGARFRLKASFPISSYSRDAQVVLRAMKTYGLVLADNGSPWFFQGTSDSRWASGIISQLGRVPASAFQAVTTSSLRISANSGAARRR
jgi:hypothetical protein